LQRLMNLCSSCLQFLIFPWTLPMLWCLKTKEQLRNICITNGSRIEISVSPEAQSLLFFGWAYRITGFVTRVTQWVRLVEQELLTLPEHLSSPPVFSGVHVDGSFVLCVCFVDLHLPFCSFSFNHCIVCP